MQLLKIIKLICTLFQADLDAEELRKQLGELERRSAERKKVLRDALQKANKNRDKLRKYLQQLEERWGSYVFVCASQPWCETICNARLHVGNYPVSHAVNTKTHKYNLRQIRHVSHWRVCVRL